jgi:hypothetical protein
MQLDWKLLAKRTNHQVSSLEGVVKLKVGSSFFLRVKLLLLKSRVWHITLHFQLHIYKRAGAVVTYTTATM